MLVQHDDAIVDALHAGRLDEAVIGIPVGRVERMVNLEVSAALGNISAHVKVADHVPSASNVSAAAHVQPAAAYGEAAVLDVAAAGSEPGKGRSAANPASNCGKPCIQVN